MQDGCNSERVGHDWFWSCHRIFHSICNIYFHNNNNDDVLSNLNIPILLFLSFMESCLRPGLSGVLEKFSDQMTRGIDLFDENTGLGKNGV